MVNNTDKREENLRTLLPFGESLKPLISSSSLSENDLRFFLQRRGIFVPTPQKNITIPIISSILLSPREFDILKNRQHIKESNLKVSTAQSECTKSDVELISVLDEDIILKIIASKESEFNPIKTKTCKIIHDEGKVIIEGISIRKDWKKDILSYETEHSWKLTVDKPHNSKTLQFRSETTIPETKTFITELQKELHSELKKKGVINNEQTIQRVLAVHFKKFNSIFKFLLEFAETPFKNLLFERISNIKCGINGKATFPKNFEWLKESVEEISLQGNKLETSDIIELGKQGILIFGEVDADFSFHFNDVKGKCTIRYGFPNYFQKFNQIEFEAKVQTLELKKEFAHFPKESAKRLISEQFLENKHKIFQNFINNDLVDINPKSKNNQYKLLLEDLDQG